MRSAKRFRPGSVLIALLACGLLVPILLVAQSRPKGEKSTATASTG